MVDVTVLGPHYRPVRDQSSDPDGRVDDGYGTISTPSRTDLCMTASETMSGVAPEGGHGSLYPGLRP